MNDSRPAEAQSLSPRQIARVRRFAIAAAALVSIEGFAYTALAPATVSADAMITRGVLPAMAGVAGVAWFWRRAFKPRRTLNND
jgi:hypothetical protein